LSEIRPPSTGVYDNLQRPRDAAPLKNAIMLPQYLRDHGYQTLTSGPVFHYDDPVSWTEEFRVRGAHDKPSAKGNTNGIEGLFDWGPLEGGEEEMSDMMRAKWAAGLLSRKWTQPTTLACGFFRPHLSWHVP
jgi:arylsulfatase A-like enzyme